MEFLVLNKYLVETSQWMPSVISLGNLSSLKSFGLIVKAQLYPLGTTNAFISMTSLFAHKVAQPTKCRFLTKNLSQLVIFVIGLAFTWV